jgi:dTDP-4-amino-4,6-dideoxygalactose transaminase
VDAGLWREFADAHGLVLIEDAAHAVGVENVGRSGDASVFSFFGNKNMTTAEGGMVISRSNQVLTRVRQMRNHGMTSSTAQRLHAPSAAYDVTMLGYNYRMDELRAAIGLVQIAKLSRWNEKRKFLMGIYRSALKEHCSGVIVPFSQPRPSSHHIMPIVLPSASLQQKVMTRMREAEIQTTVHYPPVHRFSLYRDRGFHVSLPRTEEFARRELTLPLHPKLEAGHVEAITVSLAKALAD